MINYCLKASQLTEKAKAAEAAYQKAVDTANEVTKETFSTHLPPVLDSLQQLEEERYALAKSVLESYHKEFRTVPDLLIERADELSKALEALGTWFILFYGEREKNNKIKQNKRK